MPELSFVLKTKGSVLPRRTLGLFALGFTGSKTSKNLALISSLAKKYHFSYTFTVPAVILNRYSALMRRFKNRGAEIALHGLTHTPLTKLSTDKQKEHVVRAFAIAEKNGFFPVGFRAPYLLANEDTLTVLGYRFLYDSSLALCWYMVMPKVSGTRKKEMELILRYYAPLDSRLYPALPLREKELIRLPVSLPDDELLLDRLKLSSRKLAQIWCDILESSYSRGEMFVLLLHPDRLRLSAPATEKLIKTAKWKHPPVWIASLRNIARWWRQRTEIGFDIRERGDGFEVLVDAPYQATILVRDAAVEQPHSAWFGRYKLVYTHRFFVRCALRPVIGLSPTVPQTCKDYLREEGFCIEETESRRWYSLYIDNIFSFRDEDKLKLIERIEASTSPLVRVWRWPYGARSVLSITCDVDAVTVWDHILRLVGS